MPNYPLEPRKPRCVWDARELARRCAASASEVNPALDRVFPITDGTDHEMGEYYLRFGPNGTFELAQQRKMAAALTGALAMPALDPSLVPVADEGLIAAAYAALSQAY